MTPDCRPIPGFPDYALAADGRLWRVSQDAIVRVYADGRGGLIARMRRPSGALCRRSVDKLMLLVWGPLHAWDRAEYCARVVTPDGAHKLARVRAHKAERDEMPGIWRAVLEDKPMPQRGMTTSRVSLDRQTPRRIDDTYFTADR